MGHVGPGRKNNRVGVFMKKKETKYCTKCGKVPVRKLYCSDCRRDITLERMRFKWQTDPEYRDRHRVAARLSFRKTHGIIGAGE
jgi:hypothetical protein